MTEPQSTPRPEPVVLIIADISGYTRYMTANAKTLAHSQTLITELIKAILTQVDLPLEVAKLEGDAIFLFGRKTADAASRAQMKEVIGRKLLAFFGVFGARVRELSYSNTCSCHACAHIASLRLKLIVHSGEALFHRVLNFQELAGVDVIIVHRLLKNSVAADQYVLMTEAAQRDVAFPEHVRLAKGAETYDDLGRIVTAVYYPDGGAAGSAVHAAPAGSFSTRFVRAWKLFLRLWMDSIRLARGHRKAEFRHVASDASPSLRIGFAILMLLLAPVYLPAGSFFVALRVRKPSREILHHNHPGEHHPGGSCCEK